MNFYFEHIGEPTSLERTLLFNEVPLTGGSVATPLDAAGVKHLNFTSVSLPGYVLHNGSIDIDITYSKSGQFNLTPIIYITDDDPATVNEVLWVGDNKSSANNTTRMKWTGYVNFNGDLRDHYIILRFEIRNDAGFLDTFITFSKGSNITLDIRDGAKVEGDIYSEINFGLFQRRYRGIIYAEYNGFQKYTGDIHATVGSIANVSGDLFSSFTIHHKYLGNIQSNHELLRLIDLVNVPQINSLELDDQRLKDYYLQEDRSLYDIVNKMEDAFPVIVPPGPIPYPFREESDVLTYVGEKMIHISEDLHLHDLSEMPGGLTKAYRPSALYGGNFQLRNGEWQLPDGFVLDQKYTVSFDTNINIVDYQGNPEVLERASAMWFLLRHRDVDAHVSAVDGNGNQGNLVLNQKVSSSDMVMVWHWTNPLHPFVVHVRASNSIPQLPGFAGKSAMMVVSV